MKHLPASHELQNYLRRWAFLLKIFPRYANPRLVIDQRARSWARQITKYPDLPEIYKPFFQEQKFGSLQAFPYTVVTPTFKGGHGRPENERLLWIRDQTVGILELFDGRLRCTYYESDRIVYLERGSILLHAWITLVGHDGTGYHSTTIRFNSVSDPIMAPFLSCLRAAPLNAEDVDMDTERHRFDFLAHSNFKFMSYGQGSLQTGARVFRILFQPRIRSEILKLAGFSLTRRIQPAHLIILTDSELVIIRDDDSQPWSRKDPYGAIWSYIPRARILDCSLNSVEDGRLQLTLELLGGKYVRIKYLPDKDTELTRIIYELKI